MSSNPFILFVYTVSGFKAKGESKRTECFTCAQTGQLCVNSRVPYLLESGLLQLLFDILHVKELPDVSEDLAPVLRHLKTLGKITLDVPVLMPVAP